MEQNPYIVYVKTNEDCYITAIDSSAFLNDTSNWTEIDSGHGDKYAHAQGNYLPKSIMIMGGAYRYKLVDGKAVECTAEEIEAQELANRKPAEPTQLDRVEAQVTYTAIMTDTLILEV